MRSEADDRRRRRVRPQAPASPADSRDSSDVASRRSARSITADASAPPRRRECVDAPPLLSILRRVHRQRARRGCTNSEWPRSCRVIVSAPMACWSTRGGSSCRSRGRDRCAAAKPAVRRGVDHLDGDVLDLEGGVGDPATIACDGVRLGDRVTSPPAPVVRTLTDADGSTCGHGRCPCWPPASSMTTVARSRRRSISLIIPADLVHLGDEVACDAAVDPCSGERIVDRARSLAKLICSPPLMQVLLGSELAPSTRQSLVALGTTRIASPRSFVRDTADPVEVRDDLRSSSPRG